MTATKTGPTGIKPASHLPWSLRVVPVGAPDSALPKGAAVWLGEADYVAVLAADGTVVCDNANYYPAAVKPEDAAYIVAMAEREAALIAHIRTAVADFMISAGCDGNPSDEHDAHYERLAQLLNVPMSRDGYSRDFFKFRTLAATNAESEGGAL